MYIGHRREDGQIQPLREHLRRVEELAGEFGRPFGAEAHARRTGRIHDAGKYSPAGRRRMADPEHAPKVDHTTAGAQIARDLRDPFAAFAVAGHHAGLMDRGSKLASTPSDGTLWGRLKKDLSGEYDYSAFWGENEIERGDCFPKWLKLGEAFSAHFYTRMLFSCLVDADWLDTEAFMRPEIARDAGEPLSRLLEKLKAHVISWLEAPKGELNRARCDILRLCLNGGAQPRGVYTLTVPTGGGKTVSSLAFALAHACFHGQRRIVYVVPYTSIIEQNAAVFADIVGADNVLEHHANADFEEDEEDAGYLAHRRRLASENWDMPIIVTTAVQFFESLYAAGASRLRKLHNLADSVIVFDEAQLLPLSHLAPCVAGIAELARHYGASAVLCTATQPALNDLLARYAPELPVRELIPDAGARFAPFRRVRYQWEGQLSDEALAERLVAQAQTLCVVNQRSRARKLVKALPREGRFHLSTWMTPQHRSATLAEIRRRLNQGKVCRVVSTSLIEAGVDVDFPDVWREEAGLDSILQAGGRCNREGRRPVEESVVHIFSCEGRPLRGIEQNIAAMRMAVERRGEIDGFETVRDYFEILRALRGAAIDLQNILPMCQRLEFRSAAQAFHLIDEDTQTVYIPSKENGAELAALRGGAYDRKLLRKLGRSAVNVYRSQFRTLLEAGKLEITQEGFAILADLESYDAECGLAVRQEAGTGFVV